MNNYTCIHCKTRTYKSKYYYDRHISVCKFLSKTPKEQEEDIDISSDITPTQNEMFQLIKHLSYRIDKLEKENEALRRRDSSKINILNWLNNTKSEKPVISFDDWISIELTGMIPNVLNQVFENDLIIGFEFLMQKSKNILKLLPICSYNKSGILYVYCNNNMNKLEWKRITSNELDVYIEYLCNRFIVSFNETWFEPNKDNIINSDKYKDNYLKYYQKILASQITKENRCNKIRQIILNNVLLPPPIAISQ